MRQPSAKQLLTPARSPPRRTSLSFAALQLCHLDWFNARTFGLGSAAFTVSYTALQVRARCGSSGSCTRATKQRVWRAARTAQRAA